MLWLEGERPQPQAFADGNYAIADELTTEPSAIARRPKWLHTSKLQ